MKIIDNTWLKIKCYYTSKAKMWGEEDENLKKINNTHWRCIQFNTILVSLNIDFFYQFLSESNGSFDIIPDFEFEINERCHFKNFFCIGRCKNRYRWKLNGHQRDRETHSFVETTDDEILAIHFTMNVLDIESVDDSHTKKKSGMLTSMFS